MGRNGISSALLGMLAASSVYAQTTDTSTTSTDSTTVIPTTVTTEVPTTIGTSLTSTLETTVLSTTVTVSSSTALNTTTSTISSSVSSNGTTTSTSSTSSTGTNAPQYTGATFHIESAEGDVGEAAPLSGATRKDVIFDVRSEYTLDGFGHLVFKADGYIAQTNAGSDTVYADVSPSKKARVKRQAVGTPLTCSVATSGILTCTGASGSVFYTDGTNLYLGAAVPTGFTPITLIAVIDAAVTAGPSSSIIPTGPLPTAGPTTPAYAGWGQWSYPQPTGVPVALTTSIIVPGPNGLTTQTITVTSLHCGCTETPLPTTIVMTTYVTECPTSWGYTAPVTVVVPVKPTGAVWGAPSGSTGGSSDNSGWITYGGNSGAGKGSSGSGSGATTTYKPAGNSTGNTWSNLPYTGAASAAGASAGLLTLSVAMLAFLL